MAVAFAIHGAVGCAEEEEDPARSRNGAGGPGAWADGGPGGPLGPPDEIALARLSRDEYEATLSDLLREIAPTSASAIMSAVAPVLTTLGADQRVGGPNEKHGGFERLDQSVQQAYADAPFTIAYQIGGELTKSSSRVAEALGACAAGVTSTVPRACVDAFMTRLGELALRRPPTAEDLAFYAKDMPAADVPFDAIGQAITLMLASPWFLYHVESGGESSGPAGSADAGAGVTKVSLDAWELASRLAYHFTGTMPDKPLRDAARSGALLDDAAYAKEVDRLARDPRADKILQTFFLDWLWPLLELPALDSRVGDPVFDAFAGANRPTPALRSAMVDEVLDTATYTLKRGGTVKDFLGERRAFAKDPTLAAIYGVAPWDGKSEPGPLPPERVGLLTRAAFLTTGTANTRPVMKGVFIRTTLLCDEIPAPPNNAANIAINLAPNMTTREVVEQVTEQAGTGCSGCHQRYINPLGFASESFDGLGRFRTAQTLFDATGHAAGQKPVNTSSVPGVVIGDTQPSSGIADVARLVAESGKVEACLARKYFRFAFRRLDGPNDAPVIDDVASVAKSGAPLLDVMKKIALRPEFKERFVR